MPAVQVLNPQAVQDLVETFDAAIVLELIEAFLEDSLQLVHQMQQGIQNNDAEVVQRAAHTLKSQSKTFGLEQLAPLCQKLETLAAGSELPDHASDTSNEVQDAYRLAQNALRDLRESLRAY
ncbi:MULTISPECIES: Hpt domain-containing protein [unclassified Streptomyces]|uniref:Hpt domain-containing protein n=1 Tax=Streptomyces sp. NBC_00180 TaxID=2903632 RepID=A0AAU1I959_9ACTN|nr:Hpt domain-containing protein [Streptomyces sp. NBC_01017]WSV34955.1 Hpt domain-containing protein [Streptomyces sp. NBC_01017]